MLPENHRVKLIIKGAVQGVGFRPFIYRLATELNLTGWVNNSAQGVCIELEGKPKQLETFLQKLEQEKPPLAIINSIDKTWLEPLGYENFTIHTSAQGEKTAIVLPDIATCPECRQEIFDPTNRRYHYPFTNCTNCGPRYTIIDTLPYDRHHTTMKGFEMCPECQAEYTNPLNRRFHAQPNACPRCGPHLELWDDTGTIISKNFNAIEDTANALMQGKIVAIKGLGGFHLMVDAKNEDAVQLLRQRKQRPHKPFALMYPDLEVIKKSCQVGDLEAELLHSPAAPIVLLKQRNSSPLIAPSIAPNNPYLGVMLPYTPLHHLLLTELGFPVVATSGNLSDEPICIDEQEALQKLGNIADLFLVHNRPIIRPVDDSIVRVVANRPIVLRRARGYAPLPLKLSKTTQAKAKILAVGGHLKNTVALTINNQVIVSQHLGDLSTKPAFDNFQAAIKSLANIYDFKPDFVACDYHPDYQSSQFASQLNLPVIPVQHHYAHVLAGMVDNQLETPVLGIAWDGTGYGLDQTIWGGEFLYLTNNSWQRVAHLKTFPIPGGESAIKHPNRIALGLLYSIWGEQIFTMDNLAPIQTIIPQKLAIFKTMLQKQLNTPQTSSIGRLFDAISSLLGLCQTTSFEGQGSMTLEFALEGVNTGDFYPIYLTSSILSLPLEIDLQPMIVAILKDRESNLPPGVISAKFHNTLVELIVKVIKTLTSSQIISTKQIVLTGGCFQNKYLTERAIKRLRQEKLCPYWHQNIPPNDGGISLGQTLAALR